GVFVTPLHAQSGGQVIRACVDPDGDLRVLEQGDVCRRGKVLTWNTQGPAGPAGPAGAAGAPGLMGLPGPEGLPGRDGRDGRDGSDASAPAPKTEMSMKISDISDFEAPVLAFSLGGENPATPSGAGQGKANFTDLVVTKMVDALSVPMLKAVGEGKQYRDLVLSVFEVRELLLIPIGKYTFSEVAVTSEHIGGTNASLLSEQVSFSYRSIKSEITLDGTTFTSCWDRVQSKAC
ncbi:MAG: type VI secretion system tube protein Hcp, partial [Vicinamibacterales bacterium]